MNPSKFIFSLALLFGFAALPAHSQAFWLDGSGSPIRTFSGACVHASAWTPNATHPICNPPPQAAKLDRVVLLPGSDGKVGRVIITIAKGSQEISNAFGAVSIGIDGSLKNYQENAASVAQKYAAVLGIRPQKPQSYILYFQSGGGDLTAQSTSTYAQMKVDVMKWVMPEVTVIGHTDTVGSASANDVLSLRRAQAIVKRLVDDGLKSAGVQAIGRGESDLLVPTPDNVAQAANRRVQIDIR